MLFCFLSMVARNLRSHRDAQGEGDEVYRLRIMLFVLRPLKAPSEYLDQEHWVRDEDLSLSYSSSIDLLHE